MYVDGQFKEMVILRTRMFPVFLKSHFSPAVPFNGLPFFLPDQGNHHFEVYSHHTLVFVLVIPE